jgi:DNA-binding XRE family transcriptional regulator
MSKFVPQKRTQLIEARERQGWTGAELAKRLSAYKSTVYRIEAGVSHPSLALMQKWVAVLPGVSMEMFWAPGAKARPGKATSAPARDAAA